LTGTVTVTNSTFSKNSAGNGGAIFSLGPLTVTNSTFSDISAGNGGAIFTGSLDSLTVINSTFSGNSGYGGAIIYAISPLTGKPVLMKYPLWDLVTLALMLPPGWRVLNAYRDWLRLDDMKYAANGLRNHASQPLGCIAVASRIRARNRELKYGEGSGACHSSRTDMVCWNEASSRAQAAQLRKCSCN
jgi:predicted outer membrane repeat protein